MIEKTQKDGHPEGGICEQLEYLLYLSGYPNCSDMKELSEIPHAALGIFKK